MKAYQLQTFGFEGLKQTDLPKPEAGPGEVLVRVQAVSLNYRDLMTVAGGYNPHLSLPLVPCSDGAGIVEVVGPGVTRFKPGDRVAGTFVQEWQAGRFEARYWRDSCLGGPLDGMLREFAVLPETGLVSVPDHLTLEEAATLPCAAVTAWNALVVGGQIKAGDTVLVQGTGGVSLFALQFARMHGAQVIATSSSNDKLGRAKALGASDGINYRETPDWDKAVRSLTGGEGVDHVVEVGGAGTLPLSLKAVRAGGHIAVIGVLTAKDSPAPIDPLPILLRAANVRGVLVGSREMFEAMNRAITINELRPIVDRVFPFAQAHDALRHMESGSHFGKIVISLADESL